MNNRSITFLVLAAFVGLFFLMVTMGSWFTVDQGERTIVLRNGSLSRVADPGLGFKLPFIDSTRDISVRDHTQKFDKVGAYSYDTQPAVLVVSATYRVPAERVAEVYTEYGSVEALQTRIIERQVLAETRNVFGRYTAAQAIQKREQLSLDVKTAVARALGDIPVVIAAVQVESVDFSDVYEKSIEQRMLAEVQIETTRQLKTTSEINAEIQVIKATADANAKRQQFTAEADGIKLRGEAEAAAIEAKAKALQANTNLVQLNAVEKWNGTLPQTMVPGSTVPFIGVK